MPTLRTPRFSGFLGVLLLAAGSGLAQAAGAPAVTLAGVLGSKALLVIDGQSRALAPGDSVGGVRLVSFAGDRAVVEADGQRLTLVLGGQPTQVQSTPTSRRRIVMAGDSAGHFRPQGTINGSPVKFMIDTGASVVALGRSEADRLGVDYAGGTPVLMGTANGVARGWKVKLAKIRIGQVEVQDIDAVVTPQSMPFVLLGNSFLSRFRMTRTDDEMVLEKRS